MNNSLFTTEPFLTGKPLEVWLASMGIKDWSINAEGLVDVEGAVDLGSKLGVLKRLPIRFGNIGGNFLCNGNELVSLEGAPKQVGGYFWCDHNHLVSLEGAPKQVGGYFSCSNNQLVSLEGGPKGVGGFFDCSRNQLLSLEGAPKEVGGWFRCVRNQLADFIGIEGTSIAGDLIVTASCRFQEDNVFVSLEGLPKELYGKVRGYDTRGKLADVVAIQAMIAAESQLSGIPDIEI